MYCNNDIIYGNKGARLNDIKSLGILTPSFVIIPSNQVFTYTVEDLHKYISQIELDTNTIFGDDLFVSVRSSSQYVMPGIMETKLNISSYDELNDAIKSIIKSSTNKKCIWYKKTFNLNDNMPFGIIIQKMVYGNKNEYDSGSGIYITRNPITGISDIPYGEFKYGVMGDKIANGISNPLQISIKRNSSNKSLEESLPNCYTELLQHGYALEKHYRCAQEIEFTIENGILYILQTRNAIISSSAMQNVLLDLVKDNIIDNDDLTQQFKKYQIKNVKINTKFNIADDDVCIAKGINSSNGYVAGKILIYNSNNLNKKIIEPTILVAKDTTPIMLPTLQQCVGCLTKYGGTLCHAAIVCRALNIPAITGCNNIDFIDENTIKINNIAFHNGDSISIDGNNGYIYAKK